MTKPKWKEKRQKSHFSQTSATSWRRSLFILQCNLKRSSNMVDLHDYDIELIEREILWKYNFVLPKVEIVHYSSFASYESNAQQRPERAKALMMPIPGAAVFEQTFLRRKLPPLLPSTRSAHIARML